VSGASLGTKSCAFAKRGWNERVNQDQISRHVRRNLPGTRQGDFSSCPGTQPERVIHASPDISSPMADWNAEPSAFSAVSLEARTQQTMSDARPGRWPGSSVSGAMLRQNQKSPMMDPSPGSFLVCDRPIKRRGVNHRTLPQTIPGRCPAGTGRSGHAGGWPRWRALRLRRWFPRPWRRSAG
jgi:hypothetical protein